MDLKSCSVAGRRTFTLVVKQATRTLIATGTITISLLSVVRYPPDQIHCRTLMTSTGYNVLQNRTALLNAPNDERALGIFSQGNMPVWLDRNVYTNNLETFDAPYGSNTSALDLPGLKDMTLKAIDILEGTNDDAGWFLMSEAASIDKQFHVFDYDRALGDLLEFDDTIAATIEHLAELGILDNTLLLVTADHAQGYDVAYVIPLSGLDIC